MMVRKRALPALPVAFLIVLSLMALPENGHAQAADRAYVNGTIYTVDQDFSTAQALAVRDGRFIYVGDDEGVRAHIGPNTFVVDLEGRTIIPGLHDAHVHIRYGERELYPRTPDIRTGLGEWASVERMQDVIKQALTTGEGMRPGPEPRWIVLSGWMSDVWDPPVFQKELLDAAAPDNPVYISRYTHGSGANSKALELAGITRDYTRIPRAVTSRRTRTGDPTGEFVERAPPQLTRLIPSGLPSCDRLRAQPQPRRRNSAGHGQRAHDRPRRGPDRVRTTSRCASSSTKSAC